MMISVRDILQLTRFRVSLAVTFSAVISAINHPASFSPGLLIPLTAIFLIAAGASALNQCQESHHDAIMDRTRNRPVASGRVEKVTALVFAAFMIISGFIIMAVTGKWICLLLGMFNIIWYNGFYTWMKTRSAFAVVPGALTGAIPVLMGWSVAGNSINAELPWLIAFFIFMWQIPHFWIMMLKYGDEYHKAGFPVLPDHFNPLQMKRIIMAWLIAASFSSILLVMASDPRPLLIPCIILIMNVSLLVMVFQQLFFRKYERFRLLFVSLNFFMLAVLLLITIQIAYSQIR